MSWCGIEGHDRVVERFRGWLRSGKLPSTFLFVGPRGSGKRSFARQLARCLHCESHADEELKSCGECAACRQVDAESHPDIVEEALPKGKAIIPIAALIGDPDHRMREGFCYELSLKPMYGRWRIGILDDADTLGTPVDRGPFDFVQDGLVIEQVPNLFCAMQDLNQTRPV